MDMRIALLLCAFVAQGFCYPEEENTQDPDLFESDMRLTPMQRLHAETGGDGGNMFGSAKSWRLWLPSKTVPYTLTGPLASNPGATLAVMLALNEWETQTCVKFVERTVENDHIEFFKNCSGCWSYVGRIGGKQNICLSSGCWGKGTITHEIAHALGFWHEQSRPDRDDFIRVVWPNIPAAKKHNFKKHSTTDVDSLGTKYDYISVMQYSKTAFGINGSVTMDPIQPGIFQLGQRVGFSETDSVQAKLLYSCNGSTTRPNIAPKKNVLTGPNDCDFDSGLCHFQQDQTDDFDFRQRIGPTPSGATGPDADHTTQRTGAYVYIEASSPRRTGDAARLISGKLSSLVKCMKFHYHMKAASNNYIGTLNVYKQSGSVKQLLFTRNTVSGSEWIEKSLTISSTKSYQIIFEAIRGRSYQGDIALDDISFSMKPCAKAAPVMMDPPKFDLSAPPCTDVNDREAQYCKSWAGAGYCTSERKHMAVYCPKTCSFC